MEAWYRTATELYTSSLRAMEQRSAMFLLSQSFLVGAFAYLFVSFEKHRELSLFASTLIIAVIGLVYAIVFFVLHKVTSKDAAYWRAYMRFLEGKFYAQDAVPVEERPWHLFYKCMKNQKRCCKLGSWEDASSKLPGPILWLGSPAIFLVLWVWLLTWIIQLYWFFSASVWCWFSVALFLTIVIAAATVCRYCKSTDNMLNRITKAPSEQCTSQK